MVLVDLGPNNVQNNAEHNTAFQENEIKVLDITEIKLPEVDLKEGNEENASSQEFERKVSEGIEIKNG